jgi:hypothetical protein
MGSRLRTAATCSVTLAAALLFLVVRSGAGAAPGELPLGWNNVAYFGVAGPPSEALSAIAGKYNAVYRWNAALQQYEVYSPQLPSFANTLSALRPGDVIWLNVTAAGATLPTSQSAGAPLAGTISIPASAFVPGSDLALYEKSFNELYPVSTDAASQRYYAPVFLPDGAVVTSMKAYFVANSGEVALRLDFTPLANGSATTQVYKLAEILSSAGPSPQTVTAYPHVVDNATNVYFLVVDLTGGPATRLRGVSISYAGGQAP